MKKNKGFTLIELLAVIAILAILIILALPNIMSIFNQTKEESFITELKQLVKFAQNQWMSDSIFETEEIAYCRSNKTDCQRHLKLSGRKELDYYVKVDKGGKIIELYATDGTYQYVNNTPGGLNIEDINEVDQVSQLEEDEKIYIDSDGPSIIGYTNAVTLLNSKIGTGGLIKDDHNELRYQGSTVNNYATFNGEVAGWRIIGLFNVDGKQRVKLVKDQSIGSYSWNGSNTNNNQWGPSGSYTGATLMNMLNDYYYNGVTNGSCYSSASLSGTTNTVCNETSATSCSFSGLTSDAKELIGNATWYTGGCEYGSTLATQYSKERGNTFVSNPSDGVTRTGTWVGKIALIYPSDYLYASSNESCKNDSSNSNNCKSNNWLFIGNWYWAISPRTSKSNVVQKMDYSGKISNEPVCVAYPIRPSVYLVEGVKMKGLGTTQDPYVFIK